jgi:LacI family transcriptional regulator
MVSTIKDVARQSGLSIATISKYINGGSVRNYNKVQIDEAISSLGYRVNSAARALKTNKTNTIGVLIPDLRDVFCTTIVSQIENILLQSGYSTIICDFNKNPAQEKEKLKFLVSKMVDGLVIIPKWLTGQDVNGLIKEGLPIICIDVLLKDCDCDTLLVDNLNAAYSAVELLITNRHKRIGIINGPEGFYTADERLRGYYRVFRDYFMSVDENLVKRGEWTLECGFNQMNELLDLPEPPTAVFVTNYTSTMGAIMAINKRNIKIPDELSFIGFDSIELANVVNPQLNIVKQPMEQIAATAADMLLDRLNGGMNSVPELYRLKAELLSGDSVADLYSKAYKWHT